jgi:hypothetical protein
MLCNHFFRAEFDGIPVMFFVDDEALANMYGGSSAEAAASLVDVVRTRLDRGHPRQLFRRVEADSVRWKLAGGEGPPPGLPLLGLAVLAATRMGRSRDRAAHNYYKPFCELIGSDIEQKLVIASYRDAMPYLWQCLQWWLDDNQRGGLGFSTIVEDPYFAYIGYADSQTLFSSSDRDKLTQFFRWIRLRPGEQLDQTELITYFRIWASRRDDLSEGAAHMLESDEYAAQLARIIKAAADRWRGVVREDGHRGAAIAITLELFPRPRLALVAERPPGFPEELVCDGASGRPMNLVSSHEGWYDELSIHVSTAVLDTGIRLAAEGAQLRLPQHQVYVLEKNSDLGRWASVPQLSPGEPAWLLVRRSTLDNVKAYLERNARRGWRVIEREAVAPRGWCILGEVVVQAASDPDVPELLAPIVPRVYNRFSLRGGLALPRGSGAYLTGGEPDVWLPPPPGDGTGFELKVDEHELELPERATHVRLAARQLHEGAHTVEIEGIRRGFSTVRTLGHVAPQSDCIIAHQVRIVDDVPSAMSAGAKLTDTRDEPSDVRVVGVVVSDPERNLDRRLVAPLILPTGALRRVVIGPRPGYIEEVPAPSKPPWMTRAGLSFQFFEFTPSFDVVWIVTEWTLSPEVRVRLKQGIVPMPSGGEFEEVRVKEWATVVARSPTPSNPHEGELWATYLDMAARVATS